MMRKLPYVTTRLTFWNGDDFAVWVRAELPGSHRELQAIGEHVARDAVKRSRRVFVWLYTSDMDTNGPAFGLTFMASDRSEPLTTFVADPLMAWAFSGADVGRA
ncbi:MAG: hypothetical protein JSV95_01035 [Gemmatimonadota bacterium]|jgi:hypothetical protein|nr:MAG: hypothetical protein JSV95_01035 [Gemmatimonadota bacterium]